MDVLLLIIAFICCDVAVANIISVKILERPLNALNVSVSYDKCYVIFL